MTVSLHWVTEVEGSHANRLFCLLMENGITCNPPSIKKLQSSLLYSEYNIFQKIVLPNEFLKAITRIFYVPYSCRDISWMTFNTDFIKNVHSGAIFKIQANPKCLEDHVLNMLEDVRVMGDINVLPLEVQTSLSKYSHTIQVVYDTSDCIFHWGIRARIDDSPPEREDVNRSRPNPTNKSLNRAIFTPVSRAYYKLLELIEYYFPKLGWVTDPDSIALDIGASPGGWSQLLSLHFREVISIDPGALDEQVLKRPNVRHIRYAMESEEVKSYLSSSLNRDKCGNHISMCVCDVNFYVVSAAKSLLRHILPYVRGYRQHCVRESSSTVLEDHQNVEPAWSYLILTVKLPKKAKTTYITLCYETVCDSLASGAGCRDFHLLHLNANSSNERTIICRLQSDII